MPQAYDFFNGADPDAVVLAALEKTRAALAKEYGSDDVATWRAPLDQHVFDTRTISASRRPARTRASPSAPR